MAAQSFRRSPRPGPHRSALGRWISLILLATSLIGCGGSDDLGPTRTCSAMQGVWRVSADYGNGLVAQQQWTILQSGCDLQLSGQPPDPYGPLLTTATGGADDTRFWTRWSTTYGACQIHSDLDAQVTGNTFAGTLYWIRSAHGQGYCASGSGQLSVTGQR